MNSIVQNELIKNTPAKFISCKNGKYYFQSGNYTLIDLVHELARKYPDEEFELIFWNADPMVSEKMTIRFKRDGWEILAIEPIYHYSYLPNLTKIVGEDVLRDFLKKLYNHFESVKNLYQSEEEVTIRHKAICMQCEYDKFKLEAVSNFDTLINIRGYYKSVSGTWKLIDDDYKPKNE